MLCCTYTATKFIARSYLSTTSAATQCTEGLLPHTLNNQHTTQQTQVTLTLEGKVLPDGPVFLGPTEKTLTVGDGEMPEGLERGLEKIKKGQPALIICQPQYAYGDAGNAELGVPPNAQVQFHVTPTSVQATYELDLADKISAAERRKQQGNTFYLAADLERAMTKYEKAYSLIEHEKGRDNKTDGDECNSSKLQDLKMALHLNKAAVFEKQGRYVFFVGCCASQTQTRSIQKKKNILPSLLCLRRKEGMFFFLGCCASACVHVCL